jgi:hypothetical protein
MGYASRKFSAILHCLRSTSPSEELDFGPWLAGGPFLIFDDKDFRWLTPLLLKRLRLPPKLLGKDIALTIKVKLQWTLAVTSNVTSPGVGYAIAVRPRAESGKLKFMQAVQSDNPLDTG